jgi:hypothetical protein
MKKTIITILFASTVIFTLTGGVKSDNGKSGQTGSPGESTCKSCHSGASASTSIALSSNIPSAGYVAGSSYQMKVVVKHIGRSLFGFDVEALNSSNVNNGILQVSDATHTHKATSNSKTNIVHNLNGGSSSDSAVFNFEWVAPATGMGTTTFYFSGISADGNGKDNSADYTVNGNNSVSEQIGSSGIHQTINNKNFNVYPTLVTNSIYINTNTTQPYKVEVYSLKGDLQKTINTENNTEINLSEL